MIKKVLLLGLVVQVPISLPACELPRGEVLTIGCSYNCDFFYRARLILNAWSLGYSTEIIDLSTHSPEVALAKTDAVLLPGGADINPDLYSVPALKTYIENNRSLVKFTEEGKQRDGFEYELVKQYSSNENYKELPMLGICRGLQMMSVAKGIPLYLDLETEVGISNRMHRFDKIERTPASLMSKIYSEDIKGYKIHHQGIRVAYFEQNQTQYPTVKLTAFSHDNKIAEAIEYTDRPALGVQYHPERSFSGASTPIFKWFLTKACEYKNSRKEKI
ncbi:gamma-glutamyl-gamma-aminobutyrate hydrolase family protein [Peredibacter sp. HCB2-198]|uniref:gamma-glutamyl-gamma-aminobutyrate hydrolase family protein n=1 Tax=Peredibacter sp. HCB2-198 TaxID=3383025 RepID=UPI0038B470F2